MPAEVLFWGCLGAVLYSYLAYPLIVALMVRLRGAAQLHADDTKRPTVSMVIALYNEEAILPEKLSNLAATEYPQGSIEFVLGSDGSTDRTAEILSGWDQPNRRVLSFVDRRGKTHVLNELVPASKGDIIVFSDGNTMFEPSTVAKLVRWFADPRVGAVCGELKLLPDNREPGGTGEVAYWMFENWLKKQESDFQTLLGATGGVYAIRRSLFAELPTGRSIADDFLVPLRIVKQGFRVVYARDALAYEKTSGSMKGELDRKARIGAQNFAGIADFTSLLGPGAGFVAFALWSHKIIRWCVPLLALIFLASSVVLANDSSFYHGVLLLEIGFLIIAAAGFIADRRNISLAYAGLPYYITAMNAALLVGFYRFLTGQQKNTWEILR